MLGRYLCSMTNCTGFLNKIKIRTFKTHAGSSETSRAETGGFVAWQIEVPNGSRWQDHLHCHLRIVQLWPAAMNIYDSRANLLYRRVIAKRGSRVPIIARRSLLTQLGSNLPPISTIVSLHEVTGFVGEGGERIKTFAVRQ